MKRVLLTGMSGTGKSTIVAALRAAGHRAVDTDYGWSNTTPDGEWVWDEALIEQLLADENGDALVVAGTASNQGKFSDQFDHIVLLSAPVDVIVERLGSRSNNPFGKSPEERARVLSDIEHVEPLLRRVADVELDTRAPVDSVVASIVALIREPDQGGGAPTSSRRKAAISFVSAETPDNGGDR